MYADYECDFVLNLVVFALDWWFLLTFIMYFIMDLMYVGSPGTFLYIEFFICVCIHNVLEVSLRLCSHQ